MAGTKSRYTRLLVGTDGAGAAWDFSSESNKLGVKLSGEKLDDTTFQSSGKTAVAGDPEGSITQSGYWTSPAAGTFDGEMVDAIKNAESLYVAALFGDNVAACPAYVAEKTTAENVAIEGAIGGLITVNGDWGAGTGIVRALRLASGNVAATGALTYIDLGAAGLSTGRAWLFVTNITGTATNATFTVQCDDNTGFSSPTTKGTFTLSAGGVYVLSITGGVDRYVRLNCTSKGGATSFDLTALIAVTGIT